MERDDKFKQGYIEPTISTHTLTWSVTGWKLAYIRRFDISTHTLTWSVTSSPLTRSRFMLISTHTLTWSVTSTSLL